MRFKRNFVTIVYSIVFILLMLLCSINVAALSYEYFSQDGMGIIFAILMAIGIILIFIASFFLREKAVLKGIQKETVPLIICEGVLAVILTIVGFCLFMDSGIESAIWFGAYLLFAYGVCRMMGGRLCGIVGLAISLALSYLAIDTGWAVFDSSEILCVLCILVPFFVYLVLMKKIIPQFGKSNGVVIFALTVLSALFGAFICLNPLVIILLIGCALALLFANLRTVDTFVTKGPFMAAFLVGASVVFAFIMSFLLEKDLFAIIPASEQNFDAAMDSGYVIGYFTDKIHNMLATVLFHAFDFGIFSIILLVVAAMAGVYAIRRKLTEIGPMLLVMIFSLFGYVIFSMPESHGFYMTYLLGVFSAYGLYNMLLPEFLTDYEDEESEEMFEIEEDASPIFDGFDLNSGVKEEVADENRNSSTSESGPVSEAATAVDKKASDTEESTPTVNVKSESFDHPAGQDSSYQEWHVSNEYVRAEENRKEREAERERELQVAKEQKEAKDEGKSEEEIKAIAETSEVEKKQSSPNRVLYTGEDTHPTAETISASIPPMSLRPADPHVSDVSRLDGSETNDEQLHGTKRPESDTIVLSGYQNGSRYSAPTDILTAINDTEIPQVEIPEVSELPEAQRAEETASESASSVEEINAEANEAAEELSKAAATFGTEEGAETEQADPEEQLNNLLDRLDVSDSIKRMSETAREDMADVIEHADDKTEAEVVLKNEDYKFGTGEGEYGEVPTISELEDRWRAEEQLKQTPEELVPDVVKAEENSDEITLSPVVDDTDASVDETLSEKTDEDNEGFTFDFSGAEEQRGEATTPVSLSAPETVDATPDILSFDSVADTSEERIGFKADEPDNEDVSLNFDTITNDDEFSSDIIESSAEDTFMSFDEDQEKAEEFVSIDSTPEETTDEFVPMDSLSDDSSDEIEFEEVRPDEYGSVEPPVQEIIPDESAAVEPNMIEILPEEPVAEESLETLPEDEFVSFRDMATATVPEEIMPISAITDSEDIVESEKAQVDELADAETLEAEAPELEPIGVENIDTEAADADTFEGVGESETTEAKTEEEGLKITKFEPERIELPPDYTPKSEKKPTGPMPVINHTEQSPVFSFTRMDITAPKEDVEQLGIPKPGMEGVETASSDENDSFTVGEDTEQVETPIMTPVASSRPMAAMLDETLEKEEEKKGESVHTEEVVTRTGAGTRSYHKIIIK